MLLLEVQTRCSLQGDNYNHHQFAVFSPQIQQSQKMFALTEMVGILGFLPSWPILSAGVFVAVSGVLSLFLICEHLAVYYLPEVLSFMHYYSVSSFRQFEENLK